MCATAKRNAGWRYSGQCAIIRRNTLNARIQRNRGILLRAALVALWLGMVGWLVMREAYPHLFTGAVHGYRALLGDVVVRDDWMRILVFGKPAGYSHTAVESGGNDPGEFTTVRNELRMQLNIMERPQILDADMAVNLDAWQQLRSFTFRLSTGQAVTTITGRREKGTRFAVRIRSPSGSQQSHVDIPDDAILSSAAEELAVRGLRPGQTTRLTTFDPASMSVIPVRVEALRRETLAIDGTNVQTTVLASMLSGLRTLLWVDAQGRTVRADTGMGWTMEACAPAEAYAAFRAGRQLPQDDMLERLSVSCHPPLHLATPARRLKLRLSGVIMTPSELITTRQQAVPAGEGSILLTSVCSAPPTTNRPPPPSRFLASTLAIQADDPEIVAAARKIVQGRGTPLAQAAAIHDWVFTNLKKQLVVTLPNARDVLHSRQGKCTEHALLSVALARAVGIPAVVKVGLVWHEGAFYYHAWPAFFVGNWIETDPTLGQPFVDASHLALAEGELADQAGILKFMGRLRIEVLEAE